jgi:hypothetical protein
MSRKLLRLRPNSSPFTTHRKLRLKTKQNITLIATSAFANYDTLDGIISANVFDYYAPKAELNSDTFADYLRGQSIGDPGVSFDPIQDAIKDKKFRLLLPNFSETCPADVRERAKKHFVEVSYEINNLILKHISDHPNLLYEISSERFEEICATALNRSGYKVHITPPVKDGGYDIIAVRKDEYVSALYLVECKRHLTFERWRPCPHG